MSNSGRQEEWGSIPDRARQPRSAGAAAHRRGQKQRRPGGVRGGYPQPEPGRPKGGSRSRFVAVVVLLVAAVVVVIVGLAAAPGDGSGDAVPISLLPFPQDTVTTSQ